MTAPDRIPCCVPFCKHTRGQRKGEPPIRSDEQWICDDHWLMVPPALRWEITRRKRLLAKRRRRGDDASGAWRLFWLQWDRCKAAAIERAAGI